MVRHGRHGEVESGEANGVVVTKNRWENKPKTRQ